MDGAMWALFAVAIAAFVLTVFAVVDAFRNGRSGWGIGILVGWLFGLGWVVAGIYLVAVRAPRVSAARARQGSSR